MTSLVLNNGQKNVCSAFRVDGVQGNFINFCSKDKLCFENLSISRFKM